MIGESKEKVKLSPFLPVGLGAKRTLTFLVFGTPSFRLELFLLHKLTCFSMTFLPNSLVTHGESIFCYLQFHRKLSLVKWFYLRKVDRLPVAVSLCPCFLFSAQLLHILS